MTYELIDSLIGKKINVFFHYGVEWASGTLSKRKGDWVQLTPTIPSGEWWYNVNQITMIVVIEHA
jgi:hypothetical protein